jgi:hypothetical protein
MPRLEGVEKAFFQHAYFIQFNELTQLPVYISHSPFVWDDSEFGDGLVLVLIYLGEFVDAEMKWIKHIERA